jgi:hypothetical protein
MRSFGKFDRIIQASESKSIKVKIACVITGDPKKNITRQKQTIRLVPQLLEFCLEGPSEPFG